MPFIVITGTYHLVGRTSSGEDSGFEPDGDSIQFKPGDATLLDRLERIGRPHRLTSIGSTQLRFEGIDALELHFQGSHQPRPLADVARDFLTGELALNPVPYQPPGNTRVQPPVERDGATGYILSRSLEANGRPVAFAFAGDPPAPDGSELFLDVPLLEGVSTSALSPTGTRTRFRTTPCSGTFGRHSLKRPPPHGTRPRVCGPTISRRAA